MMPSSCWSSVRTNGETITRCVRRPVETVKAAAATGFEGARGTAVAGRSAASTTMTSVPSGQRFAERVAFLLIAWWMTEAAAAGRYVSNLDGDCMRCLCQASTLCNETIGCSRGYCGPYYLHREYWRDAGQVVLQDDDPDRDQAFVDCAADSACAQKVVENYMMKWGRDCNKNGVTDCDDYARTHFNGREDCSAIEKTNFWRRYETCRPVLGNRGKSN